MKMKDDEKEEALRIQKQNLYTEFDEKYDSLSQKLKEVINVFYFILSRRHANQ